MAGGTGFCGGCGRSGLLWERGTKCNFGDNGVTKCNFVTRTKREWGRLFLAGSLRDVERGRGGEFVPCGFVDARTKVADAYGEASLLWDLSSGFPTLTTLLRKY